MDSTYPIDKSAVTSFQRQGSFSDMSVVSGQFASIVQGFNENLSQIIDQSNAPPQPTAEQLAASKPYLEVWQNGKKIADISQGGFLTVPNSVDVSAVTAQDGTLSGKALADQRAQLVKEMLGGGAEIRTAETTGSTTATTTNAPQGGASSYLRWLTQNS